jgi:hypothetical protein
MAYSGMQINGSMEVSQEFGYDSLHPINTSPSYVCDGWGVYRGGTMAGNAYAATGAGPLFPGFANCLILTVTTAQASLGAGDFQATYQVIEGHRITRLAWGTANAQPLTIGFWIAHARAGTYTGAVRNGGGTQSCAFSYTQNVAGIAEFKTVTIPGCTAGAWPTDNTGGLVIAFVMAAGSTYLAPSNGVWYSAFYLGGPGQVNAVAATTDAFRLTGVVVLPGIEAPSAARSPLIMRPYDQELVTCQRYWQKSLAQNIKPGTPIAASTGSVLTHSSNGTFGVSHEFPVSMRSNPTVVLYDNAGNGGFSSLYTTGWSNSLPVTPYVTSEKSFYLITQYSGASYLNFDWTADARL